MFRKVKRIAAIILTAAILIVMLTSCKALSVVNDNPVVLKVAGKAYTAKDFLEVFNNELYTYVYGGGEAEHNPDYASQTSYERMKVYQDYVYDKLIEQAMREYIVENDKLADKLTDEDNAEIDKRTEEVIKSDATQKKDSDVSESDTTLEEMKEVVKDSEDAPTEEAIKEAEEKVDTDTAAEVTEKMAAATDATESDDVTASDDATESDDTEKKSMTEDEAKAQVAKEKGFDSFEDYVKDAKEKAVFALYFEVYKPIKARELFEKDYEKDNDGKTFEEYKNEIREEKKQDYLVNDKVDELLKGDFSASDEEVKAYFDDEMKKLEDMDDSEYYSYLDTLLKQDESEDNEGAIVYIKDGYYYVKHILLNKIEDDTESSDTTASDDVKVDPEKQAEVEESIAEINAMDNEKKALKAFDVLMEKYGEDPGMQSEPGKTSGYLMGAGNSMVEEFSKASEELFKAGKVGAVSGAVKSSYGIHYIQLVKIVDAKKSVFDDVKDAIKTKLTEEKASEYISEQIAARRKDVAVTEYRVRIRQLGSGYAEAYFGNTYGIGN